MGKKMLSRDDKKLHHHVLWPKKKPKEILSSTYIKSLNVKDESFASTLPKNAIFWPYVS